MWDVCSLLIRAPCCRTISPFAQWKVVSHDYAGNVACLHEVFYRRTNTLFAAVIKVIKRSGITDTVFLSGASEGNYQWSLSNDFIDELLQTDMGVSCFFLRHFFHRFLKFGATRNRKPLSNINPLSLIECFHVKSSNS